MTVLLALTLSVPCAAYQHDMIEAPEPATVEELVAAYFPVWAVDDAMWVIGCETGWTYDPNSKNKWSGASGYFQHMPRYWAERSAKAGWAGYSIFHPEANVAVAAWLWGQTGTWAHWSCKP